MPNKILNWAFINSVGASTIFTLNIITGILNNITMILPITMFLSLSKFIELEIDDKAVKIGDPITKVKSNNAILLCSTSSTKQTIGIITRKGNWKKSQEVIILIITMNSRETPLIIIKIILPSLKSSW